MVGISRIKYPIDFILLCQASIEEILCIGNAIVTYPSYIALCRGFAFSFEFVPFEGMFVLKGSSIAHVYKVGSSMFFCSFLPTFLLPMAWFAAEVAFAFSTSHIGLDSSLFSCILFFCDLFDQICQIYLCSRWDRTQDCSPEYFP